MVVAGPAVEQVGADAAQQRVVPLVAEGHDGLEDRADRPQADVRPVNEGEIVVVEPLELDRALSDAELVVSAAAVDDDAADVPQAEVAHRVRPVDHVDPDLAALAQAVADLDLLGRVGAPDSQDAVVGVEDDGDGRKQSPGFQRVAAAADPTDDDTVRARRGDGGGHVTPLHKRDVVRAAPADVLTS